MFYDRHHDFVNRYGIAGSQTTMDRVHIVSMLFVYSFTYTGVQHYFHIICRFDSNMTGVTCKAGTAIPSGSHEVMSGF